MVALKGFIALLEKCDSLGEFARVEPDFARFSRQTVKRRDRITRGESIAASSLNVQGKTTMRKMILVLGFSLAAVAFSVMLPGDNQLFAVSGCCKHRTSKGWKERHRDLAKCRSENQQKDDDNNVLLREGTVWWDRYC